MKINVKNETIELTSTESKKAFTFGTKEYKNLQAARRDYPDFETVTIENKRNNNDFSNLDMKAIRTYVTAHGTDDQKEHPDFTITYREFKKNTTQEHYAGMTYAYMVDYIIRHEQPEKRDEMLNKFSILRQDVAGLSKGHRYPIIKRWFLMSYPEVTTLGMEAVDIKAAS